jgi:hypothetical protein
MDSPLPGYWLLTRLRQISIESKRDPVSSLYDVERRRLDAFAERLRQRLDCRSLQMEQDS